MTPFAIDRAASLYPFICALALIPGKHGFIQKASPSAIIPSAATFSPGLSDNIPCFNESVLHHHSPPHAHYELLKAFSCTKAPVLGSAGNDFI